MTQILDLPGLWPATQAKTGRVKKLNQWLQILAPPRRHGNRVEDCLTASLQGGHMVNDREP